MLCYTKKIVQIVLVNGELLKLHNRALIIQTLRMIMLLVSSVIITILQLGNINHSTDYLIGIYVPDQLEQIIVTPAGNALLFNCLTIKSLLNLLLQVKQCELMAECIRSFII